MKRKKMFRPFGRKRYSIKHRIGYFIEGLGLVAENTPGYKSRVAIEEMLDPKID